MRFKKYRQIIFSLAVLSACLLNGCSKDFLDQKPLSAIDETAVYRDSTRSLGIVTNLYTNIGLSFNARRYGNTGLDAASDESEPISDPNLYTYRISNGGLNASNVDKTVWTVGYQMVRSANIFLKNKDSIPVGSATRDYWTGQVRFLRAWYLFMMVKHHGGIPLIGNKVYAESETINIPRNTFEECVNYISAELDTAAALLPVSYPAGNINQLRVSRGAVLGAKSRLLLYAASPLFNSARTDDLQHLVSYATADNERWKKAADAARAVINLGVHNLYTATPLSASMYNLFLLNTSALPISEHLLAYWQPQTTANNNYVENSANPQSRSTVNGYVGAKYFPTQELVDEFDMINGLRITDPASGYPGIGDNMYKNRDPRLTATVHYNGSIRNMGSLGDQPVNTYTGVIPTGNAAATSASVDGIYTSTGTITGYFRYKMSNNFGVAGGAELYRPWVLMRYAEILLNAAEATNEYSGPTAEVYGWLTQIRARAGIVAGTNGLYGLKANMTKAEMQEAIRHERRVELAFEEHRYWDVRRWKIAPQIENAETHGMEITRSATGTFSYRTIVIRKHVFTDAMYFWPIPQSELVKSAALKQNPGY